MKSFRYQFMIIASAVMFGVAPVMTRMSFDHGGNGISMPLYMAVISLPIFLVMIKREKLSFKVTHTELKKLFILSTAACVTSMLLMFSYSLIPVGMATTLHFVYPVVVAFGLVIFFKEKMNALKIAALAVAVAGIAATSMESGSLNIFGLFIALLSGVFWAFYIIYLDKSGLSEMSPYLLGFYLSIFSFLESGIVGAATGNLILFTSYKGWLFAIGATFMARVLGGILFQLGIRGAGSLSAGILSTFEPITSVIIGILLLGEGATVWKVIGCLLVISGVCLIVFADYRKETESKESL